MIVGVLGASGFIGQRLTRMLSQEFPELTELRFASSKPEGSAMKIDLNSQSGDVDKFFDGLSIFYNCAGVNTNQTQTSKINVEGIRWLIERTNKYSFRWVQVSSVGVYQRRDAGLIKIDAQYEPNNFYEKSKLAADEILVKNLEDFRIIRPSTIVGEGMPSTWGYRLIDKIVKNQFFYLGYPNAVLNVVDIQDVVGALLILGRTDHVPQNAYIVNDPILLSDLVNGVKLVLKTENKSTRTMPKLIAKSLINFSFLARLTGVSADAVDFLSTRRVFDGSDICKELNFRYRGNAIDSILKDYFARMKQSQNEC